MSAIGPQLTFAVQWLDKFGLGDFASSLASKGVTSEEALSRLTDKELRDLGLAASQVRAVHKAFGRMPSEDVALRSFLHRRGIGEYFDLFVDHRLDVSLIPSLTDADLGDMGIEDPSDRRLLLSRLHDRAEAATPSRSYSSAASVLDASHSSSAEPQVPPAVRRDLEASVKEALSASQRDRDLETIQRTLSELNKTRERLALEEVRRARAEASLGIHIERVRELDELLQRCRADLSRETARRHALEEVRDTCRGLAAQVAELKNENNRLRLGSGSQTSMPIATPVARAWNERGQDFVSSEDHPVGQLVLHEGDDESKVLYTAWL